MVSAAYDLLDRSYRSQKQARLSREAATAREASSQRGRSPGRETPTAGTKVRVLNDTTVTAMGTPPEIFSMARRAAALIGEVSSIDSGSGMILVTAEFLHMPPCQVTLTVVKRGIDRVHVRCSVDALSPGEAPPVAAVTRLVAQKLGEVPAGADGDDHAAGVSTQPQRAGYCLNRPRSLPERNSPTEACIVRV